MKFSTTLKRMLTHANPRPKRPVLALQTGSDLEEDFAAIWKNFGRGPEPVREYKFAAILKRHWRFDFAWPEQLAAVEMEGIFRFGDMTRHQTGDGYQNDLDKYNAAIVLGWRVLRFSRLDLKRRPVQVVDMVQTLLDSAANPEER